MPEPILSHQIVTRDGVTPERYALVLHGVFGMGTNFRGIARAVAARDPSWGFILADLRGHGASQGLAPPHDLAAAAADLSRLVAATRLPVAGVVGHSFGGKVALAFLERTPLAAAVVLDSMPGARPMDPDREAAASVLRTLEELDRPLPSREAFQAALRERGFDPGIVAWLTMNVRRDGDAYRLRLDLAAIRSMLSDYFARDLWPIVEDPRSARAVALVIAGRSAVFDAESRARAARAKGANPSLEIVEMPSASHWVHVDDPQGVTDVVARTLARPFSTIPS